jgi:hypothetical protein
MEPHVKQAVIDQTMGTLEGRQRLVDSMLTATSVGIVYRSVAFQLSQAVPKETEGLTEYHEELVLRLPEEPAAWVHGLERVQSMLTTNLVGSLDTLFFDTMFEPVKVGARDRLGARPGGSLCLNALDYAALRKVYTTHLGKPDLLDNVLGEWEEMVIRVSRAVPPGTAYMTGPVPIALLSIDFGVPSAVDAFTWSVPYTVGLARVGGVYRDTFEFKAARFAQVGGHEQTANG